MKNAKKVLLGLCALLVVGCGGNGNGKNFVGSYVGMWTDANAATTGALNLTVDGNAHLSGTLAATPNGTGTITGTIFDTGFINSNVTFTGTNSVMHLTGSVAFKDQSATTTSGIHGTITGVMDGVTTTYNVDADRP